MLLLCVFLFGGLVHAADAAESSLATLLCASLSSLSDPRNLPRPDGLISAEFSNLSWIPRNCIAAAAASDGSQLEAMYISAPVESSVVVSFFSTPTVAPMSCVRHFRGTIDTQSNMLVQQTVSLVCEITPVAGPAFRLNMSSTGDLQLPVAALSALVPFWTGRLELPDAQANPVRSPFVAIKQTPNASVFIDEDVFDGAPAISAVSSSGTASPALYAAATFCQTTLEQLPFRIPALQTVPSAISGSLISAFGSNARFPNFTAADLPLADIVMDGGLSVTAAAVRTTASSCSDAQCDPMISVRLASMVAEAGAGYCTSPVLVPGTLRSSASLTLLVNATHAWPRALAAVSTAVFACAASATSFLGITVGVRSPAPVGLAWPLDALLDSVNVFPAIAMQQQIAFVPSGRLAGRVQTPAGLYMTPIGLDLFSGSAGGLLVPDAEFDPTTARTDITTFISNVESCLTSPMNALNKAVSSLFFIDGHSYNNYAATSPFPTWNNFFISHFASVPDVRFAIGASGQYIIGAVVSRISNTTTTPTFVDRSTLTLLNQSLVQFSSRLIADHPTLAGRHSPTLPTVLPFDHVEGLFVGTCLLSAFVPGSPISAVPLAVNTSAIVNATLSFADTSNPLFSLVELTFDYHTQTSSFFARISPSSGINGSFAFDSESQTVTALDVVQQPATLGLLLDQALVNCSKMQLWTTNFFAPVDLSVKMLGDSSWPQFLAGVIKSLSNPALSQSMDSISYAHFVTGAVDSLRAQTLATFPNPGLLHTRTVAVQSSSSVAATMRFTFDQIHMVNIAQAGTPWATAVDTTRITFPVFVRIILQVTALDPEIAPVWSLNVNGTGSYPLFSTAVATGMASGIATTGNLSLQVDYPGNTSSLLVAAQYRTLFNTTSTATVMCSNLGQNVTRKLLINGGVTAVDPSVILTTLQSSVHQILPLFLSGTLTQPFPPFAAAFNAFSNVPDLLSVLNARLAFALPPTSPIAKSDLISTSAAILPFVMNISINNRQPVSCLVPAATLSPTNTLVQVMQRALCSCDSLCTYLQVVECRRDQQDSDTLDPKLAIGLLPAVPGILHTLRVNASSSNVAMQNLSWTASTGPMFSSWRDVSELLFYLARGRIPFAPPTVLTLHRDDVANLIPPSVQSVYPTTFTAIELPFFVSFIERFGTVPLMSNMSSSNQSVTVFLNNTVGQAMLSTTSSGRWSTLFGAPPVGFNSMLFTTNFSKGSPLNFSSTVTSNTSVFDLALNLELRGPGGATVTPIRYAASISLPVGETYADALLNHVVPALDIQYRPLLNVSIYNISRLFQPQVILNFSALPLDGGKWLIPISVEIGNTTLPCLDNNLRAPPTTRFSVQNLALRVQSALLGSSFNATALLGVTPALVAATRLAGTVDINATLTSLTAMQLPNLLPSFRTSSFYTNFQTISRTVNNISLSALQLVRVELSSFDPTAAIHLLLDDLSSMTVNQTFSQLLASLTPAPSVSGLVSTVRSFRNLLATTQATLCTVMTQMEQAFETWADHLTLQGLLPFSNISIGFLLEKRMNGLIPKAVATVCSAKKFVDINTICALLGNTFASSVCSRLLAGETHFELNFHFLDDNFTYHSKFTVDSTFLRLGSLHLPSGTVASKGDIYAHFSTDVELQLLVDLDPAAPAGVRVALGPETHAMFSADFRVQGGLMLWFGPLLVSAADTIAEIGNPVTVEIDYNPSTGQFSPVLTGQASFEASLSAAGADASCALQLTISSLSALFEGDPDAIQLDDSMCGSTGDIVDWFTSALANCGIDGYLGAPGRLIEQLLDAFGGLSFSLFGGSVGDEILPVIGTLLTDVAEQFLLQVIDDEAMRLFGINISAFMVKLEQLSAEYPDPASRINYILPKLTALLCDVLPIIGPCPPSPTYNIGDNYAWPLRIGKLIREPFPTFSFGLDAHGLASLDAQCQLELDIDVELRFTLEYVHSKGIRFSFPTNPVFLAEVDLKIDPGCDFSGSIGLLGVDFQPGGKAVGMFQALFNAQDETWSTTLTFDAVFTGPAELGLAGPLSKDRIKDMSQALAVLPHFQAVLDLEWHWKRGTNATSVFKMLDPALCVSTFFTHMVQGLVEKIKGLLDPLEPLLGPSGILLRNIAFASFLFGRNMNILELLDFIVQLDGGPSLDDAVAAVEKFAKIYEEMEQYTGLIKIISGGDPNCGIRLPLQNFSIDFSLPDPEPVPVGDDPSSGINFPSHTFSPDAEDSISQSFVTIQKQNASFEFPFLENKNALHCIVDLILGVDFPVFLVVLPSFEINIHPSPWVIPVWGAPEVDLTLSFRSAMHLGGLRVGLTAHGLLEAINTRSVGKLFSSLGYETRDMMTNQPLPPLFSGMYYMSAGVRVSVYIFAGGINVFGQLDVMFTLTDIDGRAFVTFSDLMWVIKNDGFFAAFDYTVDLTLGLEFYIQACIPLIFTDLCWDIVDIVLGDRFGLLNKHGVPVPQALSGNNVNLDCLNNPPPATLSSMFSGGLDVLGGQSSLSSRAASSSSATSSSWSADASMPKIQYSMSTTGKPEQQGTSVQVCPVACLQSGVPCRDGTVVDGTAIGVVGSYTDPLRAQIGFVVPRIVLPASPQLVIDFDMSKYTRSGNFTLSSTFAACMDGVSHGIEFVGLCNSLNFLNPTSSSAFTVTGTPSCSVTIEAKASSNVTVSGDASDFLGPLFITKALRNLAIKINEPVMDMEQYSIALGSALINTPAVAVSSIIVFGTPAAQGISTFNINGVAAGRTVEVDGASDQNIFNVQMRMMQGGLKIAGHSNKDFYKVVLTPLAGGYSVVLGIDTMAVLHPVNGSILQVINIPNRQLQVPGVPDANVTVHVGPLQPFSNTVLQGLGQPGGAINYDVTQCATRTPYTYVNMTGPGNHTCHIGSNNKLDGLNCNIELFGSLDPNGFSALVMYAQADMRNLVWTIGSQMLSVQPVDGNKYLQVSFDNLDLIEIYFGNGTNQVKYLDGTLHTDVVLRFQSTSLGADTVSLLRTSATVVVDGAASVIIGATASSGLAGDGDDVQAFAAGVDAGDVMEQQQQQGAQPVQAASSPTLDPFSGIFAPVVVIGRGRNTTVVASKAAAPTAPAQGYHINGQCLSRYQPANQTTTIAATKFPLSPYMQRWLAQEYGLDVAYLTSRNCTMPLAGLLNFFIATGPQPDLFTLDDAAPSVELHAGDGMDTVTLRNVTASMVLDVGLGTDVLFGTSPLGPTVVFFGDDQVRDSFFISSSFAPNVSGVNIGPVGPQLTDVITLHQQHDQDWVQVTASDNQRIYINVTEDSKQPFILVTNTTYVIVGLVNGVSPSFSVGDQPAVNAVVELAVPTWQTVASIGIYGMSGSNLALILRAPALAQGAAPSLVQSSALQRQITAESITIDVHSVDHVLITSQTPTAAVQLFVSGTPTQSDLAVVMDPAVSKLSSVTVSSLSGNLLVANAMAVLSNPLPPASSPATVFAVAAAGETTLILSANYGPAYSNGSCVGFAGVQVAASSAWFSSQLQSVGIAPAAAAGCAVFAQAISTLSLNTPVLRAVDVSKQVALNVSVPMGDIFIANSATATWATIVVSSTSVTHAEDNATVSITFPANNTLTVNSSVVSSETQIQLLCPLSPSVSMLVRLGDSVLVPQLAWISASCMGTLSFNTITPDVHVLSGRGLALTVAVTGTHVCQSLDPDHMLVQVFERSVLMTCENGNFTLPMNAHRGGLATAPPVQRRRAAVGARGGRNISWDTDTTIDSLHLAVAGLVAADVMFIAQPRVNSILRVSADLLATVNISVLYANMSFFVPSPLSWQPPTHAIGLGSSPSLSTAATTTTGSQSFSTAGLSCIAPATMCTAQAWLDTASFDSQCSSASEHTQCAAHVVALVTTASPLYCSPTELSIQPASAAPPFGTTSFDNTRRWKIIIGVGFFLAIVDMVLSLMSCGQLMGELYMALLLTAFAPLLADATGIVWDGEIRALTNAARFIVVQLLAGPDCTSSDTGLYATITDWYFGFGSFIVLLLLLLLEKLSSLSASRNRAHWGSHFGGCVALHRLVLCARRMAAVLMFCVFAPFVLNFAVRKANLSAISNACLLVLSTVLAMAVELDSFPVSFERLEIEPVSKSSKIHFATLTIGTVVVSTLGSFEHPAPYPLILALFIVVLVALTVGTGLYLENVNVAARRVRLMRTVVLLPAGVYLVFNALFNGLLLRDPSTYGTVLLALWIIGALVAPASLIVWRLPARLYGKFHGHHFEKLRNTRIQSDEFDDDAPEIRSSGPTLTSRQRTRPLVATDDSDEDMLPANP